MSKYFSTKNRLEVLNWIKSNNSLNNYLDLSCNYFLEIDESNPNVEPEYFPAVNFTLPNLGMSFSPSSDYYGFPVATPLFGSISINFISYTEFESSPFWRFWSNQYSFDKSVLQFIPKSSLPIINVCNLKGESILLAEGCRFTYPQPNINLGSDSLTIFTTQVSFMDYSLGM